VSVHTYRYRVTSRGQPSRELESVSVGIENVDDHLVTSGVPTVGFNGCLRSKEEVCISEPFELVVKVEPGNTDSLFRISEATEFIKKAWCITNLDPNLGIHHPTNQKANTSK